jgi:hypothetical protein
MYVSSAHFAQRTKATALAFNRKNFVGVGQPSCAWLTGRIRNQPIAGMRREYLHR